MRSKFQKRSALKFVDRIIPEAQQSGINDPAKVRIYYRIKLLDSRLRGNDKKGKKKFL
jgi:hypothetical protein